MSKEFDSMLMEEMQHEDFINITSDDNSAIDAFYPSEDENFCESKLKEIDLDEDIQSQLDEDKEFMDLINQSLSYEEV